MRGQLLTAALLFAGATVHAHQLDEFVQAARLDLDGSPVAIELSLTPGVVVAPEIIALVDRNADGVLDRSEVEAYVGTVVRALSLSIDGVPSSLVVDDVRLPAADTLRQGSDAIRIRAIAGATLGSGRHHVVFENGYAPVPSVYLVNALRPRDSTVSLALPSRDLQQRRFAIDVDVARHTASWQWSALCLAFAIPLAIRGRGAYRRRFVEAQTANSRMHRVEAIKGPADHCSGVRGRIRSA